MSRLTGLLVGLLLLPAAASAQVSEARVRAAIDDGARGLGQAVAGGSAVTGPAATTGGLGHFRAGVAATVTAVEIEDPQRSSGTVDFLLPVGTVHAALGLWNGVDGTGAVDLVGRAGPVLTLDEVAESAPLYSLGARVGVVEEGLLWPAVSVTAFRSWVDELRYGEDGDDIRFSGDVRSVSGRIDVSKRFLVATPYAGAGFDRTEIAADYTIPASRSTGDREIRGTIETSGTHHKLYAGVELALLLLSVVVEIGSYDGGAFGALGLRLGL